MAKSLRSKTKRAFRAKKRDSGVYAATEAARLNRLNAKLATTISQGNKRLRDSGGKDAEAETPSPQGSFSGFIALVSWFDFGVLSLTQMTIYRLLHLAKVC